MLIHLAGVGIANMCEDSQSGDRTAEEEDREGKPASPHPPTPATHTHLPPRPSLSEDHSACLLPSQHSSTQRVFFSFLPFLKSQSSALHSGEVERTKCTKCASRQIRSSSNPSNFLWAQHSLQRLPLCAKQQTPCVLTVGPESPSDRKCDETAYHLAGLGL